MSLRDYARKRRFGQTPEPEAQAQARRGRAPIFVVQLHHARARHYDFRLEVDGVLKSWAVPKGPSLRAGERRLAVEVEDHPLAYAGFEGDIPQGHYGAGHVDLFDRGTWSAEGDPLERIGAGKLEFELDGERLHGRYTLVRTRPSGRQPQWLLIKRSDRYARDIDADGLLEGSAKPARAQAKPKPPAPKKKAAAKAAARTAGKRWKTRALACAGARVATMPDTVELQLATLRTTAPVGEDWLHEVKWDGYRMLGYGRRGAVRLESRNALDWTERLPRLIAALGELPAAQFIVDGELVALDADGRSDFARLQRELERGDNDDLRLVLFDLLYLDGVDLRACALRDRRALLRELLAADPTPLLAFSEHIDGAGAQVFQAALDAGLEGIVSKRADAPYRGGRSGDWIKLKHAADESFVVVGYTPPKSSRKGFGSLLLATSERGGLRYVGRVGSGFSDEQLRTLTRRLQALRRQSPTVKLPGHVPFSAASVTWVAPRLTVDIHSRGRGKEGLVRQASFLRVRDDLTPPSDTAAMPATKLTHPERVVFPEDGISKAQVAAYYEAVAPWLLPELAQRPISLLRCPDGVGASCFFQKHHADSLGAGVHAVALKESSGRADYVYVDDVEGVLALVQMNTLEFHPWGAKVDDVERPDRLVFDLDPAEDVPWSELKRAARDVRDRLEELGLRSWPRLSGGKGMHVVVPIQRGPDWAAVKHFCEAFADAMVERTPLRYVATASKAKRQGRIFIDWLRNARGATSVASWSLRARAGAPVAMPLRWDELARIGAPNAFDLAKAQRRAARLRADPWEGFAAARQRLPKL